MGFKPKKGPFSAIPETSTLNINKVETSTLNINKVETHTHTHTEGIIDQKRKNHRLEKKKGNRYTYIHTPRERGMRYSFFFFFWFWVWKRRVMSGLEEKDFGFGREAICRYWKKKEEGNMSFGFGRETVCRYRKKNEEGKKKLIKKIF